MHSATYDNSGDADAQTISTFGEARPTNFLSAAEISAALAAHVQGYSPESQSSTSDRTSIINHTKLLASLQPDASEEDTGRCMYRNLLQLFQQLGPMFPLVTTNNFDIYQEQSNIFRKRTELINTITSTESLTRVAPIAPDPKALAVDLEVTVDRLTTALNAELPPADKNVKGSANARARDISARIGGAAVAGNFVSVKAVRNR